MRIKVEEHSHQHYHKIEGELISWTQTVEYFDNVPLQVPAVIVKVDEEIIVCPLKRQFYHCNITELP